MNYKNNTEPEFYNFIVDYKTAQGNDMHQCFIIPDTMIKNEEEGAKRLIAELGFIGHTVQQIISISGKRFDYEQLYAIAESKAPPELVKGCVEKILYISDEQKEWLFSQLYKEFAERETVFAFITKPKI